MSGLLFARNRCGVWHRLVTVDGFTGAVTPLCQHPPFDPIDPPTVTRPNPRVFCASCEEREGRAAALTAGSSPTRKEPAA
jgi:hypothetical protein